MSTTGTDKLHVGVFRDRSPGETRVALVPDGAAVLIKAGLEVTIESGAGESAGHANSEYETVGASIAADAAGVIKVCDILLSTRLPTDDSESDGAIRNSLREGQNLIGVSDALFNAKSIQALAQGGVRAFALELVPRISRAQSMDVLSSMATIAGYKAVLMAASELPRVFPMVISAAGTLRPARVLVIGAGVAGLQAIATANRLGARVEGYDIRPTVREQIESVGGIFIELDIPVDDAEDKGGYAKEKDESFYDKQREELAKVISHSNVVISTAAIPGRPAPLLITRKAVEGMPPGSIIVDLAASTGGNCELTKVDEEVVHGTVRILGPSNIAATIAAHASQMFSKNVVTFLLHILGKTGLDLDREDPIVFETLITENGDIPHPRLRGLLGLPALVPAEANSDDRNESVNDAGGSDPKEGALGADTAKTEPAQSESTQEG